MARNGSGTYTAPSNSWNPAVVSTTIDQADWNTLLADIETALSASIANDGQTAASGSIPFANGITADTIGEISGSGNGVTIDGVLLKDGRVDMTKGGDIASATTTDIGASTGNFIDITGTTTITALGTIAAGAIRFLQFDGILTLTHNGTSLILPTAANITTAAGDVAGFVSLGSGSWKCIYYQRASGAPLLAAEANSIDGTMIAIGSDAAGDVVYYDGTDYTRLGIGTAGQVLVTNSAADAPEWGSAGAVIQSLSVSHEANATGSSVVPNDDTIPSISGTPEMDAVSGFTQAITPTVGTNKIRATVHFNIAGTGGTGNRYVGIFKDSETDASAVAVQRLTDSSQVEHGTCVYEFVPGSVSEITFKVYMGMLTGVTNWETNGTGGPLMGGVWKNWMIVEEITV